GMVLLGIGLVLSSLTQTWWQFYLFFSFITAIGLGATGWLPNVVIVQNWFKERRGLAIGIISAGVGVGILICVPSAQYLILQYGWRVAYRIMAIFIPLVVISMAIVFLRNPPSSSQTFGKEISHTMGKNPLEIQRKWSPHSWTVAQAIRTKVFWLLSFSFFLANLITQALFTHQVAFFVDGGLEPLLASYVVGMIGIVSLGGKILWGSLSDRIGREITYTMGITCTILGILWLILFNYLSLPVLPYLYAFFFGMGYAVHAALPPLITADFFEGQGYGGIFGLHVFFIGIGGAFGAWFAGLLHDWFGSYSPVFFIAILCAFFSCLNIWWAGPKRIRREKEGKGKNLDPS
ncbi:MAG: MFS transporter, partial [Thermodesulfobacteriota bacterium]